MHGVCLLLTSRSDSRDVKIAVHQPVLTSLQYRLLQVAPSDAFMATDGALPMHQHYTASILALEDLWKELMRQL